MTDSDTEVILEAYKRYGENCVKYFEGMWAFVIFDINENRFSLAEIDLEKNHYFIILITNHFILVQSQFIFSLLGKNPAKYETSTKTIIQWF